MPPRKKPRLSSRGASTPAQTENQQQQTRATTTPSAQPEASSPAKPIPENDPVTDPWTDEQETSLLKGVIKWKPVGMHKHFRMLAISEHMKSQGYASPSEEHTRIPGIWRKLGTLYNLAPLDERESYIPDPTDDSDPSKELYCPFELPEDEFGDMMFARRLAPDGFSSPPMSINRSSVRASTVADTDEPRSSPAPTRRGGRTKKPATRTTARGTRSSKLTRQTESTTGDDGEAEDGDEEESEGGDEEEGSARNTQSPGPRGGGRGAAAGRGKKKKGRGGGTGRRGRRL